MAVTLEDLPSELRDPALRIYEYMRLGHELRRCDVILALGSNDVRVADRAAELFLAGLAPLVVFSGGVGELTKGLFPASEAEAFRDRAIELGVPAERILVETESQNTGANITLSHKLLCERGVPVKSLILVQKPFMERRAFATFSKQWPGEKLEALLVTSPRLSLCDYIDPSQGRGMTAAGIISVMCGDLQRIATYPARGFQVSQPIPLRVWTALRTLAEGGFSGHMLRVGGAGGHLEALGPGDPLPDCVVPDEETPAPGGGGGGAAEASSPLS